MKISNTVVERIVIPHTAFANAEQQIERCFTFAVEKSEAEGLAIIGESGTGKTSVLNSFRSKHQSYRGKNGMEVPVLFATVPSMPTVKSLAGVMLEALGEPHPERGTENQMSRQVRVLMRNTGTHIVIIDEFQHFYDRGKRQIMHHVADWLKVLIDDTRSTLVVAGLPSCRRVIDQNEQLARRFLAPVQLSRFVWTDDDQREEFMAILEAFNEKISNEFESPELHSEEMAFRFYCATGGLIGYLAKLLRQTLRNAAAENKASIGLGDLHTAHMQSIWKAEFVPSMPKPFERSFRPLVDKDLLDLVSSIGVAFEPPSTPTRVKRANPKSESVNSMLVRR